MSQLQSIYILGQTQSSSCPSACSGGFCRKTSAHVQGESNESKGRAPGFLWADDRVTWTTGYHEYRIPALCCWTDISQIPVWPKLCVQEAWDKLFLASVSPCVSNISLNRHLTFRQLKLEVVKPTRTVFVQWLTESMKETSLKYVTLLRFYLYCQWLTSGYAGPGWSCSEKWALWASGIWVHFSWQSLWMTQRVCCLLCLGYILPGCVGLNHRDRQGTLLCLSY